MTEPVHLIVKRITRLIHLALALFFSLAVGVVGCAEPVSVGKAAPDFSVAALDGGVIRLGELKRDARVVLIVLRGWPGYQCPVCDRQVNDLIEARLAFAAANAKLVFVYPGPLQDLPAHATEFRQLKGREWPVDYIYALDSDYVLVKAYGLRWDAPRETAYPSTFVIDRDGVVRFAKVSRTHGDRAKAAEVLTALRAIANP